MPRTKMLRGEIVPFTAEEEALADAEEAAYNAPAEVDKRFNREIDEKRAEEYGPIGDQLDAIWEFIAGLPAGQRPAKTQTALDNILAVKAANPKR